MDVRRAGGRVRPGGADVSSADRPDVLDRVERWARDSLSIASIPHARRVLALVKIARAARRTSAAWDPSPDGWSETEMGDEIEALRAALAELEAQQ